MKVEHSDTLGFQNFIRNKYVSEYFDASRAINQYGYIRANNKCTAQTQDRRGEKRGNVRERESDRNRDRDTVCVSVRACVRAYVRACVCVCV